MLNPSIGLSGRRRNFLRDGKEGDCLEDLCNNDDQESDENNHQECADEIDQGGGAEYADVQTFSNILCS